MDISLEIKKPYIKVSVIIAIIVIAIMFLTQSYWMNIGIKTMYSEHQATESFFMNNKDIPDGIFILSGNYSFIQEFISTGNVICSPNSDVKLLVYPKEEFPGFRNIIVMDAIEGCK
jgi:hypothetical protein